MSKPTIKALSVLLLCTVVYYWKILLTDDYSILAGYEGLSQGYGWLQYWILAIRDGALPLWDPYGMGGHPFGGEMQSAAFYPLHFLLAWFPFTDGVVSPLLFQVWFALTHFLGGCLMFALAREFGLRRFPSLVAAICFSLGGLLGAVSWPDMVDSAIWLPLIFLFLLRALRAELLQRAVLYASLTGLALGLSILGGRLHMAIMQALFIASAVAFAAIHPQLRSQGPRPRVWIRPLTVLAVAAGVGFCAGAMQLLVSMEYSRHAVRFFGAWPGLPAAHRIPSNYPTEGLWPSALLGMLFPSVQMGGGEVIRYYLGIFPVLAAIIGIWRRWDASWVRYLAGLAALAFLYALGEFSAFYGLTRDLVPYLWMLREASRLMYLAGFAFAFLAGFGVEALLYGGADESTWRPLSRILGWVVVVCAVAQVIPAFFERPAMNQWVSFSILLIFASYILYRYLIRGHTGTGARVMIVALIMFDLTTYYWSPSSTLEAARTDSDALQRALSCRNAAEFLKSRPGRFRVQITGDSPPSIGDLFGVRTVTGGMRATLMNGYLALLWTGHMDLLNPRYVLKPASASEPGDIYHDSKWKVYENPNAYPAAWVVHEAIVRRIPKGEERTLDSQGLDLHRQALVGAPLESRLEPLVAGASENVQFGACGRNGLELKVHTESRGLLVLSEIFYPGWHATVNGKTARIDQVDSALRGVVVPRGDSSVVLRYEPWTFWLGALLTASAFLGTFLAVVLVWRRSRRPVTA
jgi:hypothetical protein